MPTDKPYYTYDDVKDLPHTQSKPGEAPFVRGPFAEMYRQKPWTIRQYTGFASAEASNAAFHTTLAEGGQGLSVAFDLATHLGFDSDHPAARADVGRTGVAIDSVDDMKRLFNGIDLSQVSVSMTMNGAVLPIMAAFIVAAEESGVPQHKLRGTIQNDILKEFMVRNTFVFAPQPSMRICADVVDYLSKEVPGFNSMSISGYHFQEAGAEPALELALTLANARAYLDEITERDLDLDSFCHRLSFFFGVGMNFFDEIAKLRAARMLWSEEVKRRGAKSERACRMKMHCQTSGWSLTAQEPQNNLMRTTIEAMAAIFGGTQSLHTNAFDEALALPTDSSARLARNTQLIMQHEAGLCDVADPWGGSYMMESLTQQMCDKARQYLHEIDQQGGALKAIESGWVQQKIHNTAVATQSAIDSGEQVIVGVNNYKSTTANDAAIKHIDSNVLLEEQIARLNTLKRQRDPHKVAQALSALTKAAANQNANLLALTIDAIRARATLGECTQALLKIWPRYAPSCAFSRDIYTHAFDNNPDWQATKTAIARFQKQRGRRPAILLTKLGLDGHDRGIKVVASALADAGYDVELMSLFTDSEQVCRKLRTKPFDVLGLSILSGAHTELVQQLTTTLGQQGLHDLPIVVGGIIPKADCTQLMENGVSDIFTPGTALTTIARTVIELMNAHYSRPEFFQNAAPHCMAQ